jgi:hypothetical protein
MSPASPTQSERLCSDRNVEDSRSVVPAAARKDGFYERHPSAVGTWLLNFVTPIGELTPEAVLNADGTGRITLDLGTIEVLDLAYDGDDVTFEARVQMPMGEFELTFEGTVSGDELSGSVYGSVGTFPITGTRQS